MWVRLGHPQSPQCAAPEGILTAEIASMCVCVSVCVA